VTGIESVPEAIRDAETNSAINGIKNTVFLTGDMKDSLTGSLYKSYGIPQVIIADPPRAGIHKKTLEAILEAAPSRIVYVSCNPASQARDLMILSSKYKAVKAQPVDMFPQTHHVENVVLLTLN